MQTLKINPKNFLSVLFSILSISIIMGSTLVRATPNDTLQSILDGTPYYTGTGSTPTACDGSGLGNNNPSVTASEFQKQNAETIIGIAKTDCLDQAAALIGLMVGMDESSLTNDANENVPLSEQNPNKEGDGDNGTSLGVFQQQIADNWSTISSNVNDTNAIAQLMTPAYAAEAFFGSPPGANVPTALQKGLQNISGWESMPPWVAAEAVQHSATLDGSNYEIFVPQATSLLSQYWTDSPAIPLPITGVASSSTGGSADTTTDDCLISAISCGNSSTPVATSSKDSSSVGQAVVCIAEQQLDLWTAGAMTAGFRANNTNSYSKYDIGGDNTLFSYHAVGSYTPQPGDLAIHYDPTQTEPYFHINIVVAVDGQTITLIGGDQGSEVPDNNIVSKYQDIGSAGISADKIIGYVSPN